MSIDHILSARHSVASPPSIMSLRASDSGDLAGSTTRMGFQKSSIRVNLSNHFESKVYTTSSPVTGNVTITTRRDVRFDHIQILLVGTSKTRLEGVSAARDVSHTFLKMTMPIPGSSYPIPRILRPGQTLTVPFEFVIPSHLTVNACNHKVRSPQVIDHHVQLPPTMGSWAKDDMSPLVARVEYAVKARVYRQPDLEGPQIKVMEATQEIRVLPASAESPPLNLTKRDALYTMSKSKTLRKGLLLGKLGRLTAEAIQPAAAILEPDGQSISETTAQIDLVFHPASADVLPPKVTAVTGKVVAHTHYSSSGIPDFPHVGDWVRDTMAQARSAYSTSAPLSAISVGHTRWAQHLSSAVRRDSGYSSVSRSQDCSDSDVEVTETHSLQGSKSSRRSFSTKTSSTSSSSSSPSSPIFHTTTLRLPISLQTNKKTFIPTFHSCIVSRLYTVQLTLSLQMSTSSAVSTVTLSLPLQVAVAPDTPHDDGTGGMGLPTFEEAEADDHLRPRVLHAPEEQYTATSTLPGYGEWTVASY